MCISLALLQNLKAYDKLYIIRHKPFRIPFLTIVFPKLLRLSVIWYLQNPHNIKQADPISIGFIHDSHETKVCILPSFARFLFQVQILIIEIFNIFELLKLSPFLNLNKIEGSTAKISKPCLQEKISTSTTRGTGLYKSLRP